MSNHPHHHELYELLAVAAEGSLSPDELERLEALTADDPEARRIYRQSMYVLAYLEHFGASDSQERLALRSQPSAGSKKRTEDREQKTEDKQSAPARSRSLMQLASRYPNGPSLAVAAAVLVAVLLWAGVTPVRQWLAGGDQKNDPEQQQPYDGYAEEPAHLVYHRLDDSHQCRIWHRYAQYAR